MDVGEFAPEIYGLLGPIARAPSKEAALEEPSARLDAPPETAPEPRATPARPVAEA